MMKIKYHQQMLKIKTKKMKMKSKKKKAYVSPRVKCFEIEPATVIASSLSTNVEGWTQNADNSGSDDWN
jgi:hypothetical protein